MNLTELNLKPLKLKKYQDAGFKLLEEVLFKFPIRYEDIQVIPYAAWQKGDKVWIEGSVLEPVINRRIRKNLTITQFLIQTETQLFQISIYNRPWIKSNTHITLHARYEGQNKLMALTYNTRPLQSQLGLQPIYSSSLHLSSKDHLELLDLALSHRTQMAWVNVPQSLMSQYKLMPYDQALAWMHKPLSMDHVKMALRTLKYEEFLRFQTKLALNRLENFGLDLGRIKVFDRRLIETWKTQLPFELSDEQNTVLVTILNDLQSSKRMYRLLQGDVGSGKTVIAALAMYANVLAHYQCAFLVPTELLAFQHAQTLKTYLPESIRIEVLSASKPRAQRTLLLDDLASGKIDILIGTHALIQPDVHFKNAGLVVADEQHRFGVDQRRALSEKGDKVDFLLMSATPIPRTLASVVFGDLDVSSITRYHASKMPVTTQLLRQNSLKSVLKEILAKIEEGDQVYVVAAAIEENPDYEVKSVESIFTALQKVMPSHIKLAMMHGRMKSSERDDIMKAFMHHETHILVATTVIEVGVNVPNANVMVIYDADRFGLSQLHQLRGRVGRGDRSGFCYLLTSSDEDLSLTRLQTLVDSNDGFEIANKDLELRGPGELFGLKQSGIPGFLVANIILDQAILFTAQKDAQDIMRNISHPDNAKWIEKCKQELTALALD